MAARINKGTKDLPWADKTRERIQASMLINRLSAHVLGKVEMESTQVKAAEILLRKALPDLSNMTVAGDEAKPLAMVIEHTFKSGI